MSEHVTPEAVQRLENGDAGPDETLSILRHLSDCADCRRFASPAGEDAVQLRSVFADALREPAEHLSYNSEIVAYVQGSLGPAERELVESHIEECDRCRIDLEDIASIELPAVTRGVRVWQIAAAILVPLIGAALLWVAVKRPAPRSEVSGAPSHHTIASDTGPAYKDPEWTALVSTALAEGRLPKSPRLLALRDESGRIRGGETAMLAKLDPAGKVIDSVRPRFRWSSSVTEGGVLTVFDEDGKELARSPRLRRSDWVCDRSLQRGQTYVWQVNLTLDGGRRVVLPAPPAPTARFHIITEQEHSSLLTAARWYPDDHILLAVLYARSGMEEESKQQLLLAAHAKHSPSVERLIAKTIGSGSSPSSP